MLFYLRTLPPITVDELSAAVAMEALEWHYGHLNDQGRAARDRADRPAWARAQMHRSAAATLVSTLREGLHDLGPMSEETAESITGTRSIGGVLRCPSLLRTPTFCVPSAPFGSKPSARGRQHTGGVSRLGGGWLAGSGVARK